MYDTLEGTIGEVQRIYLFIMMLLALFTAGMFFFQVSSVNNYKSYVNLQIERSGGLTDEALNYINQYSENTHNGRFNVVSDQIGERVTYGEIVEYQVEGEVKFFLFDLEDRFFTRTGSAVSQIRGQPN